KSEDEVMHQAAALTLGAIGPDAKAAAPALKPLLKEKDFFTHINAAGALVCIGEAEVGIPHLLEVYKQQNFFGKGFVQMTVAHAGQEAKGAVPVLIEALKDKDPDVRSFAVVLLGKIGSEAKAAVPVLIKALMDWDEEVSRQAAIALKKVDPETAAKAGIR